MYFDNVKNLKELCKDMFRIKKRLCKKKSPFYRQSKFTIIPNGGGELINKQTNKHVYNYYSRAATVYYL